MDWDCCSQYYILTLKIPQGSTVWPGIQVHSMRNYPESLRFAAPGNLEIATLQSQKQVLCSQVVADYIFERHMPQLHNTNALIWVTRKDG